MLGSGWGGGGAATGDGGRIAADRLVE
jgi:hypothetical protein